MANLKSRIRWKKWAPDVGENRTLEGGPVLFLELATDLTAAQLEEVAACLKREGEKVTTLDELRVGMRARFVEALGPYVRVHAGPHTVDGQPLANLDDYLALVTQGAGLGADQLRELQAALVSFNSLDGPDELFSLRSSGGARSTGDQRPAKADAQTDAR